MTNMDVVKAMYAAFGRQDRDAVLGLLAPDVEWVQNVGYPGGGRHVGAEAVLEHVFANLRRDWDGWQAPVAEWLDAGDIVVAVGEYRGTHRATGKAMAAAFAGLYRVRDGRIVQFRQFADTAVIADAVRPPAAPPPAHGPTADGPVVWSRTIDGVDWDELSHLYEVAPLGTKSPDVLRTSFANSTHVCFARADGRLVGAGRALADGADAAYLADMAVHPDLQGTGLGKAILADLLERSRGHKKVLLYAVPGKEGFYRKFGFRRMTTAMAMFADQDEAVRRGTVAAD